MHRRVLRFEIPIDDQPHELPVGKVVQLSPYRMAGMTGECYRVEVWVEAQVPNNWPAAAAGPVQERKVQVFGTGQQLPERAVHLFTALDDMLVWHLYQIGEDHEC